MGTLMMVIYLLVFMLVGFFGCLLTLGYLIGPFVRSLAIGHLKGARSLLYPRRDNTWGTDRVERVDQDGRWVIKTEDGRVRKVKPHPRDSKIEGGKSPVALAISNKAVTTSPEEAKVAEKDSEVDIWGETISVEDIKEKMRQAISGSDLGSIMTSAMEGNKPMEVKESGGIDKGTALKLGGLGTVIIVIFVGIYIAMKMGMI